MTRFHDRVLALEPLVFVPFDGPADDATHAYNLTAAGGYLGPGSGGTRQAAPDDMGFGQELLLNGTSQYWVADATLLGVISTWLGTAPRFAFTLQWWRSTATSGKRCIHRFSNGGFGSYIDLTGFNRPSVMLVDESNTSREVFTQVSVNPYVSSGGWQLTGLRLGQYLTSQEFVATHNTNYGSGFSYFSPQQGIRRNTAYTFAVGRDGGNAQWYFSGSLGPLAIFDRLLTADEYIEFYNASLGTEATQELVAAREPESRPRPDAVLQRTV